MTMQKTSNELDQVKGLWPDDCVSPPVPELARDPGEVSVADEGRVAQDAYEAAYMAYAARDMMRAAALFETAGTDARYRLASMHGLACLAHASGQHERALALAGALLATRPSDPVFHVLAGVAAGQLGDADLGRRHLAHAARHSRGSVQHRDLLRLAQRTLLRQQFGV